MGRRIILASGSPRRRELLGMLTDNFEVCVSKCDENISGISSPSEAVLALSDKKAFSVAGELDIVGDDSVIVIGSDTVVSYDGNILGKPGDRDEAVCMLSMLSGAEHKVYTGVTVYLCDKSGMRRISHFYDETGVFVHAMTQSEIISYIDTGECYDKAGSYAIQGLFSKFIDKINGDYYNVVGLPVAHLYQEIKDYL